jgi:ferredoxin-NADP reductase/predicted pyridoxine 5'-phosphate oxidase superfamily flavin-nucleotide-binding protein
MVVATANLATYYPLNWPTNPFHMGEVEVQKRLGVQDHVMSYAPKVVRPYMPDQHRMFYQSQPFLVVAARDEHNRMWSSLIFASDSDQATSFVTSPDPTRFSMDARVLPGDALENALLPGSDLGMLGIEFATRRRNRVNGRLVAVSNENVASPLEFKVDQSFGNCPQYIKPRDWWTTTKETMKTKNETVEKQHPSEQRSNQLSKAQIDKIQQAETIFVATGYRGEGDDPRFGNDASHRGGAAGFIKVEGSNKLLLPDYSGNNHYNTIGNLVMDSRMGITIPLFEYGGMIQLSGKAVVDWDGAAAATKFHGANRVIEFIIDEIVELPPGSFPIQWASRDKNQLQVQVVEKVSESQDVTSFYLSAIPGDAPSLPLFLPGQHLPITLSIKNSEVVARTYSLSSSNLTSDEYYRISVKRNPFGLVSRYLHDEVHAGDVLSIQKPAGDFVYDQGSDRTLVLLSAGIGITPMLPMLHKFVEQIPSSTKQAYWIHSARDAEHHPFRDEIAGLQKIAGDRLHSHVAFTKPGNGHTGYDSVGRIDIAMLKDFVVDLKNADVYMCGTDSFMADMGSSLEGEGVNPNHIHFENF